MTRINQLVGWAVITGISIGAISSARLRAAASPVSPSPKWRSSAAATDRSRNEMIGSALPFSGEEKPDAERDRGQSDADDDHRLAAASELVYGKSRSEIVPGCDGDQPLP